MRKQFIIIYSDYLIALVNIKYILMPTFVMRKTPYNL